MPRKSSASYIAYWLTMVNENTEAQYFHVPRRQLLSPIWTISLPRWMPWKVAPTENICHLWVLTCKKGERNTLPSVGKCVLTSENAFPKPWKSFFRRGIHFLTVERAFRRRQTFFKTWQKVCQKSVKLRKNIDKLAKQLLTTEKT